MRAPRTRLLSWGFTGPTLLFLLAFNIYPLVWNVVLGFRSGTLLGGSGASNGGANYARVFADPQFVEALRLTARFVGLAVGLELLLGFTLALCLRRDFRGKTALLTALLVPMMLSPAVVGLFWNLILNGNYGILNQVLISLAALNAIPGALYEAASIDRATPFTQFRRITLPLCAPLLGLAVLLRATDALKQFDLVMAITGPNDEKTQTLSTLLYQVEFRDGKVGLGASFACIVLVGVVGVATVFTRYMDRLRERPA